MQLQKSQSLDILYQVGENYILFLYLPQTTKDSKHIHVVIQIIEVGAYKLVGRGRGTRR